MGHRKDHLSAFDYDLPERDQIGPAEGTEEGSETVEDPKSIPIDRFNEVNERLKQAERDRQELIKRLASGMSNQGQQQQAAPSGQQEDTGDISFDDMDPDMAKAVQGLVAQQMDSLRRDLVDQFGPALESASRNATIEELDQRVPGFKDELMDEVRSEFEAMSPEEQQLYDNKIGIEALANRIRARRAEQGESRGASQGMDRMGMVPSQARTGEAAFSGGPREVDPWSLSDEDWEKFKQRNVR